MSAGRQAVYALVEGVQPGVLAIVSGEGFHPPNSVVLDAANPDSVLSVRRGDPIHVGDGGVLVGRHELRVCRWWSSRPMLPQVSAPQLAASLAELDSVLAGRLPGVPLGLVRALRKALSAGCPRRASESARSLLGRGPGSTPSGDDILSGALAVLHLVTPSAEPLASAAGAIRRYVAAHRTATTLLSWAFLVYASRGEVSRETAGVLRAMHGRGSLAVAAPRLLRVGSHSGTDIAHGLMIGLAAVLEYRQGSGATP